MEGTILLHRAFLVAKTSEACQSSKLDSPIWGRGVSTMKVVGTRANGEVDCHEDLGMVLKYRSSEWRLEHLVPRNFSIGIETPPNVGKQIGKDDWWSSGYSAVYTHQIKPLANKDAIYMHAMQQTNAAIKCITKASYIL